MASKARAVSTRLVRALFVDVVQIDWRGALLARARMVRRVPTHFHGWRAPELVVLTAIGVEKRVKDFVTRRVRPMGLVGELRHGVTSFC